MIAKLVEEVEVGLDSNGLRMTPEEFDAIEDYDECYQYELVNEVMVVNPISPAEVRGASELLGYHLYSYKINHVRGSIIDLTLPHQYVYSQSSRRLADRLIWTGLGRLPIVSRDLPSVALTIVSAGRSNNKRAYADRRREFMAAGVPEYWILDRFLRTLTVIAKRGQEEQVREVSKGQVFESQLLPGFELPLADIFQYADQIAIANEETENEPASP